MSCRTSTFIGHLAARASIEYTLQSEQRLFGPLRFQAIVRIVADQSDVDQRSLKPSAARLIKLHRKGVWRACDHGMAVVAEDLQPSLIHLDETLEQVKADTTANAVGLGRRLRLEGPL